MHAPTTVKILGAIWQIHLDSIYLTYFFSSMLEYLIKKPKTNRHTFSSVLGFLLLGWEPLWLHFKVVYEIMNKFSVLKDMMLNVLLTGTDLRNKIII